MQTRLLATTNSDFWVDLSLSMILCCNTHVALAGIMSTGRPHEVEGNGNIIALSALFI